jgi:hypothetical protein
MNIETNKIAGAVLGTLLFGSASTSWARSLHAGEAGDSGLRLPAPEEAARRRTAAAPTEPLP